MKSNQSITSSGNKMTILAVVAALLLLSVSGTVIDLTDETFEHQTQASTGQVRVDYALLVAFFVMRIIFLCWHSPLPSNVSPGLLYFSCIFSTDHWEMVRQILCAVGKCRPSFALCVHFEMGFSQIAFCVDFEIGL